MGSTQNTNMNTENIIQSDEIPNQRNEIANYHCSSNQETPSPVLKPTYSNITKNHFAHPKKDQGIILNSLPDIKIKEYIIAIGNIVGPKNIIAASRVSNQRIGIYLSQKEIVEKLIAKHQIINIDNKEIAIRRLIAPSKKIILSNVSPSIPNETIEMTLKNLGAKITSPIYLIKAGFADPEYCHIVSYRRFLYINPEESATLQPSFLVNYESDSYRIFIQDDEIRCFICKELGHTASKCPNPPMETSINTNELNQQATQRDPQKRTLEETSSENLSQQITEPQSSQNDTNTKNKDIIKHNTHKEKNQKKKKRKIANSQEKNDEEQKSELLTLLQPLQKTLTEDPYPYTFTLNTLTEFILDMKFSPTKTIERYSQVAEDITNTLTDLYPLLSHHKIKSRFTRIKNTFLKGLSQSISTESESISYDTEEIQSEY